ncbi:MAG: porin family protein [Bacteroidota bacterium]
MKTTALNLITLASCLLFGSSLVAQDFLIGPRVSVISSSIQPGDLLITDADEFRDFRLKARESKFGYQVGLFSRLEFAGFFIQPEALLRSTGTEYEWRDVTSGDVTFSDERFFFLDVPVNAGIKFGPFRLQGGPAFSFLVNRSSELDDPSTYERRFREVEYALQAGLGVDIWRFVFDVRYHYTINRSDNNFTVDGTSYDLSDKPNMMVFSLGYDLTGRN